MPPRVYPVISPASHKIKRMIKIVQSILTSWKAQFIRQG